LKESILYIGNKLSEKGATASTIDTLSLLLEGEGYTVYTSSSVKNKVLRFLDMILATLKFSRKVSVVLIDTYSTQNFYFAVAVAKLCRILNIPYIPILHGGNLPNRLLKNPGLSKKLFGNAKTNVSPSMYLYEAFKAKGFDNISYIPNSIEIDQYSFSLRKDITPKLLWVRSFAEIYNPMLGVEIIRGLLEKCVKASLTMVGPEKDGALKECRKETEESNLPITFTGKLEKNQWIDLSRSHDIFINTSNFDNTPVSLIEAAALGMPIVSTNVGGIPYLIDNNLTGILVPPNDAAEFTIAISSLLKDSSLVTSLSENARRKVEAFDWKGVKVSWVALLSEEIPTFELPSRNHESEF
jgi:glycosyltransferase involved in cell wall biosynthesis